MARVTVVAKARKDQGTCRGCGKPVLKGEGYRHASPGFRGRKIVRHLDCPPFRQSELTTSNMAGAYAAVEAAEDAIADLADASDVEGIMQTLADDLRAVAELYEEANSAWTENGAGDNYEFVEKQEALEAAADEAENFTPDTEMPDEDDEDAPDPDDVLDQLRDECMEFVGGLELP